MKFPVSSLLAGNLAFSETSSQLTPPSSKESPANLISGATPCGANGSCGGLPGELVWGFSCQAVVLGCADSFLFGAGKAVFRSLIACNQVPAARGRGQGTETLAWRLAALARLVFRSGLTPEHAEGQ